MLIHTYIHTHTYVHTYMHTYIHTCMVSQMNYVRPPDQISCLVFHDFINRDTRLYNQDDLYDNNLLISGVDFEQSFSPQNLGVDVNCGDRLYHRLQRAGKLMDEWALIHPAIAAKMAPYINIVDSNDDCDKHLRYYIDWKGVHDDNEDNNHDTKKRYFLERIER